MKNTIHKESISDELKPFAASLRILIKEYEKIVIDISRSLPLTESQIDKNLLQSRDLLEYIFSSENTGENSGVKHEINSFHGQLDEALKALKETEKMDSSIFSDLKSSIDISTTNLEKMKDIINISENLKVFAINSIIYSQKAGSNGKGYQIISGEFIRLSEDIAGGTDKITLLGNKMQNQISTLMNLIEEHEIYAKKHIEQISINSGMLLSKANSSIENFSSVLNDFLHRIEQVKSPTSKIMTELQKQDIIHQQLQHLMDAMDDILTILDHHSLKTGTEDFLPEDENSRQEYLSLYTLLNVLVITAEKQIKRICDELLSMLDVLESLLSGMHASILDIGQDKSLFSKLVVSEDGTEEEASIVNLIFQTPIKMISAIIENVAHSMNQKALIIDNFTEIEGKISTEKDIANDFIPVIESINNLLTLARIEQARYNLNISSNSDKINFSQESSIELSDIVEDITKSHKIVIDHLNKTVSIFNSQRIKHDVMTVNLQKSLDIIKNTESMFVDNFKSVMSLTNELFSELNKYGELFDTLRTLVDDMVGKIDICSKIHQEVELILDKLGGPIGLEECMFKDIITQKIVDKCTVDTERITLSQEFSGIKIEESSGSNITLF